MPTSKKPRRAYRTRWAPPEPVPQQKIDEAKALIVDVGLIIEEKLPRGMMTEDDLQKIRHFINLSTALTYTGRDIDTEHVLSEYGQKWERMQNAFHDLYARGIDQGIFTAKGDELNAIREGAEIAHAVIDAALDSDADRVFRTFRVVLHITEKDKKDGLLQVET